MTIEEISKLLTEEHIKSLSRSKWTIEKIFCANSLANTKTIKRWIDKLKLKPHECEVCKQSVYNHLPINLEIDHIDGDNMNNEISNLRYICQICHSRTDNYKGKNQIRGRLNVSDQEMITSLRKHSTIKEALNSLGHKCKSGKVYQRARKLANENGIVIGNAGKIKQKAKHLTCSNCSIQITDGKTGLCSKCFSISQRRFDVTKEELQKLVWEFPMTKLGIKFGVSDKAVRKRCLLFNITMPSIGHFIKNDILEM